MGNFTYIYICMYIVNAINKYIEIFFEMLEIFLFELVVENE